MNQTCHLLVVQLRPLLLPTDLKNFKGLGDLDLNHLRQVVRRQPFEGQSAGQGRERKLSCHQPLIMHDCRVKAAGGPESICEPNSITSEFIAAPVN